MRDLTELNAYRNILAEKQLFGESTADMRRVGGLFYIPTKGSRRGLKVIASSGVIPHSQGWDHVSVSLPNRCPDWNEMCKVKQLFFYPDEVCFQLHPAEDENISNHAFCLHIWRHISTPIMLPPPSMVGTKDVATIKEGAITLDTVRRHQDIALMKMSGQS